MRARWAVPARALLALVPVSGAAAGPVWQGWQPVPGGFDLGGPRANGSLLVAGSAALYTLTQAGDLEPFARRPGGYHDEPGAGAHLAVSPRQHGAAAGRDLVRDE